MQLLDGKTMQLGVCYYPEHWPETMWEDDLRRMKSYGINVARVGEFAWALFEPRENEFDFALFDRFLDLAQQCEVGIIMGTPTATPPIWLTEKYPEVLNAKVDGTLYRHGLRRHYNYNSKVYRALTERIVRKMGEHFGHHPAIIGWQIDNELNCETSDFYSQADHEAFRAYMKDKYKTLDNLNSKMGGVVWSQMYSDWSQVHLRRTTIGDQYNPHMLLEEKRFVSKSVVEYCRLQCDALRPLIGDAFITTNGLFDLFDYTQVCPKKDLDFLCYDSYPNFAQDMTHSPDEQDDFKDRNWSRHLMETRALSPQFGIMEQQSGANGWTGRMEAPMPLPGQMRLWTLQSMAHGADFVSYFRWRTAPCGTEIYWHGLNDYDNLENDRLRELKQIKADAEQLQSVAGKPYQARIAYLRDYDNEWDERCDRWHDRVGRASREGMFKAAQKLHEPMDYLYLNSETTLDDLCQYQALIYPHPVILEDETADLLRAYMEQGGQVLFCARTGYKDRYGRCPMRPMGFKAAEMCGIRIANYTFVGPFDEPGQADMNGEKLDMPVFNDVLEITGEDTRVDAVYSANTYRGKPAVASRAIGKGRIWYYGATLSADSGAAMLRKMGFGEPAASLLHLPACCELAIRGDTHFVLNYSRQPQTITILQPMTDLLGKGEMQGEVTLQPFDVLALNKA